MNQPQMPDPIASTMMQSALNNQAASSQAKMNMVSQSGPYGSLDYASDPSSPSGYRATVSLSPDQQNILNEQNQIKFGMGGAANRLLSSGGGALSGQPLDLGWSATEANLDALNRNRLDPLWQQNGEQQAQKLADQGLQPGSAGYDAQMRDFNAAKNDAYNSMYLAGHGQAVNDLTTQYNAPLNALSALESGSQVTTPNQNFVATPQESLQAPNLMGAQETAYQQQVANQNAALGGMFGLGGALIQGAGNYFNPMPRSFGMGGRT
jgi:hypothetical protein